MWTDGRTTDAGAWVYYKFTYEPSAQGDHVLFDMVDKRLQAIAYMYDEKNRQLTISHGLGDDTVSCLQLS